VPIRWLLLVLFALASFAFAANEAAIPPMTSHVVDASHSLTPAQVQALDAKLAAFEASKGRRIAILFVEGTGDEDLDLYARRVYGAWKLGGTNDDGALFLLRSEPYGKGLLVGGGLARTVTPAEVKRILDEAVSPKIIEGDPSAAMNAGVDSLIAVENGQPMPRVKPERSFDAASVWEAFAPPPFGTWIGTLVGLVFAFVIGVATLEDAAPFRRGAVTAVLVGLVLLVAGAGIGFLLAIAAFAFVWALRIHTGAKPVGGWGTFYKDFWKDDGRGTPSTTSGWSIAGDIASMVIGSALSGGGGRGGGGGFRGGGGSFSGGGASGRW